MTSQSQKDLFESIHDNYVRHYYSNGALYWKKKIVWDFILTHTPHLVGGNIAELCCGSGHNSLEIITHFSPKKIVGFDISELAIRDYKALTKKEAFVQDITTPFKVEPFDTVFIFGGLHHTYYQLESVIKNISDNLAEGGMLIVFEPSGKTIWDRLREMWYSRDDYFDATSEHSLVPQEIEKFGFKLIKSKFITGPGYLIVYNSLILRIPVKIANLLSKPLTLIDQLITSLNIRFISFCFVGIYQKTSET